MTERLGFRSGVPGVDRLGARAGGRVVAVVFLISWVVTGCVSLMAADGGQDRLVREFQPDARRSLFGGCSDDGGYAVDASPDGRWVASGHGQSIKLWNAKTGELVWEEKQNRTVHAVAFSPNSQRLAWNVWGSSFAVVDVATRKNRFQPEVGVCIGFFLGFTLDGRYLLAEGTMGRGGRDQGVVLWDLEKKARAYTIRVPGTVKEGRMSPDGSTFALATNRGCARVFDRTTGRELRKLEVNSTGVMDLAYSPDGARLAVVSGYPGSYVEIFDLVTGRSVRRIEAGGVVRAVAWSDDGQWLATGKNSAEITVWAVESGAATCRISANPRGTSALDFLPNGRLVSTSFSGKVALWHVR